MVGTGEKMMEKYFDDGHTRAKALNNRGPIRFESDGALGRDISDAYSEYGFYIFESVLASDELVDIKADVEHILNRAPIKKDAENDLSGNRPLGFGCKAPTFFWAPPLSDPFGATDAAGGRHPVKMPEPKAEKGVPDEAIFLILGSLQFSNACLRAYGHPELLKVAEAVNGSDFTPFNEALFIKKPGVGASVAWHQDGLTHWDSEDFDEGTHGFNFMAQLYGSTARNGVWVIPGTHRLGKMDIKEMVNMAGTEYLPDAVPMVCGAGDVVISNRQLVHGSFANTSKKERVTVNFGFHRRKSVLGVKAGGVHNAEAIYDEARILKRSQVISLAINARKQRFPHEESFCYQPLASCADDHRWDENTLTKLKDYNLLDLSI